MPAHPAKQTASQLKQTCVSEAYMLCSFSGQMD